MMIGILANFDYHFEMTSWNYNFIYMELIGNAEFGEL